MMDKNKFVFIGALFIFLSLFIQSATAFSIFSEKNTSISIDSSVEGKANAIVSYVRNKLCALPNSELITSGLTQAQVDLSHKFCEKTDREMYDYFLNELQNNSNPPPESYTCGGNSGFPNYSNLGLSSSSCTWHDPTPFLCKIEGGIACLWGCTNIDPNLGWHMKYFASKTALQGEIVSKGYHLVGGQFGGSYRRGLPYGYSYQVHQINGNTSTGEGVWHSEGPEPDAEPNWPGILGGWYPQKVEQWHNTC